VSLLLSLAIAACASTGTALASLRVDPDSSLPPLNATSLADWEVERAGLLRQFEELMYGTWPSGLAVEIGSTRVVDENYLGGRGRLEETVIALGKPDADGRRRAFFLVVAYPKSVEGPMPVIIGQTFSQNCQVFLSTSVTARNGGTCAEDEIGFNGFGGWAIKTILGRYIAKAPVEQYFDRGMAYANYYASTIVPDRANAAEAVMSRFRDMNTDITANSALTYWGYGWSAAIDYLETDARIDQDRIGIFGHSRHGKSALLAAIYEPRIDLVISHQSGFGGSASNRSRAGERFDRVVKSYPHWFAPALQAYADTPETLPIDQHQLLALAAPTPLLIGNGRRDVWSDPNSTYENAFLADPVWELYGGGGLDQDGLRAFNPAAELSFSMTGGSHGTTPEDIKAFFAFIDAHFGTAVKN
jgi:hypothetical protein